MNQHKNYIMELLDNDYFIQWLIHPTPQSNLYWNEIINKDEELKKSVSALKKVISSIKIKERSLSEEEKIFMWKEVSLQVNTQKKRSQKRILIWSASVAASLLLIAGSFLFLNQHRQGIDYSSLNAIDIHNQEKVRLIISNEKTLELEEDNVELVYDQQGKLNLLDDSEGGNVPQSQLNQLIVPYGKTSSIILSDGTKVWINSGSRLMYPSVFSRKEREIFVDGEIFLEVYRNKDLPFIVKTDQFEINVLGTSFNVQAYKNTGIQSVVLTEGLVSIHNKINKESVSLVPNHMYSYERNTNSSNIQEVDIYPHICWKYGFLYFESEKIENVLERMGRYYNVVIHYDMETTKNVLVSGKLDMKEDLGEVLSSIALTAPIQFEITDKEVNVKLKK